MEPVIVGSPIEEKEECVEANCSAPPLSPPAATTSTVESQFLDSMQHLSLPKTVSRTFAIGDFSEAFRLYFGTNVTVFPFIVFLGGTLGGIAVSLGVVLLLFVSTQQMDRSKMLALSTTAPSSETDPQSPSERRYRAHQSVRTYMGVVRALFAPTRRNSNDRVAGSSSSSSTGRDSASVRLISAIVCFSQFCSCCAFVMMLGLNIATLLRIPNQAGLLLSSLALVLLLAVYNPGTAIYFANVNNTTLIGAGIIILYAMATKTSGSSSSSSSNVGGGALWMWPRSVADAWIAVCIAISYISGILYVPDSETNIADRYLARLKFPIAEATEARSRHLIRRFEAFVVVSSIVAVSVLVSFAEVVFATYRERTNAVVALSLPDGATRNVLLADLCVGVAVCGTINIAALFYLMDSSATVQAWLSTYIFGAIHPVANDAAASNGVVVPTLGRRLVVRAAVFVVVQLILVLVPFFDLVMSLSGSLGLNSISFLIPPVLELQGQRRVLASRRRSSNMLEGYVADEWESITWREAFFAMPRESQWSFVIVWIVGWGTLVSGTYTAIQQEIVRLGNKPIA